MYFGKLLWEARKKKVSFRRVEISSHPEIYLLETMLKLSDAGVENGLIEREEKLCVVSIKVVVCRVDKL